MLEMKIIDYVESTNEKIYSEYCYEGQVISWKTSYSKGDVVRRFNDNCTIGQRYLKSLD